MDGLRLALIVAGVAIVAVVYFLTARRRRIDREAGRFDRFETWRNGAPDPLVDDPLAGDGDPDAGTSRGGARRVIVDDALLDAPLEDFEPDGDDPDPLLDDVPPMPPGYVASKPPGGAMNGLPGVAGSRHGVEPVLGELSAVDDRPLPPSPPAARAKSSPAAARERVGKATGVQDGRRRAPPKNARKELQAELELGQPAPAPAEMVVVLTVMATQGARFEGPAVHQALNKLGLRYGDMQAYHYRAKGQSPSTPSLFSALNAVNPGTLDPADSEALRTPGIALVMSLPGPAQPMQCFETMHGLAEHLAAELGGRVCDGSRSSLTRQAANHLREQIAEYGRRKRLGA